MSSDDQRGSATVEFALVIPLVLLVLLAVVQMSLVLKDRLALTNAAREASRLAAVGEDDAAVVAAANASGLAPVQVLIERAPEPGGPVRVTVGYLARTDLPLIGWLIPDTHMSTSAVMRQESGTPLA